jgi:DNA-binding PadR family transcriptional regulator
MRAKGYLTCRQETEPTHQRGGKRRRFYRLTEEGDIVLNLAVRDVRRMAKDLPLWEIS